ncbi:MAG: formylglycine-generating enzyme family protein [Candidatus Rokuibacteriota bacterium]
MTHFFWPTLPHDLPLSLSERELLGLPERYVPARIAAPQLDVLAKLLSGTVANLVRVIGDPAAVLEERYLAGSLLALHGDPRIDALAPQMVDIPAGSYVLGLPFEEVDRVLAAYEGLGLARSWIEKECPSYEVEMMGFRIARFPVTNSEYQAFLLDTGHRELPSSWELGRFPLERSNHPVYSVSPESAGAYAAWLSRRTARSFRLPTEAEWEITASGPTRREFPWGQQFVPDVCNTVECGLLSSSPVGMFPKGASPYGVEDMAGNVEEFVASTYGPYPGGKQIDDHLAQLNGTYRVARGGSFARFRDLARCKRRHGHHRTTKVYIVGFRLAEDGPDHR